MSMDPALPRSDDPGPVARAVELACIAGAAGLLLVQAARLLWIRRMLPWWTTAAIPLGALMADFLSGVVHWTADTWGSEQMPWLGRRFLRPFRVHHTSPADFLRRDFIDCNGHVAMLTIPLLFGALSIPLTTSMSSAAAVFATAFVAVALTTNQSHQWAHQADPPRAVAWLQGRGLLLARNEHRRHHTPPHTGNYCIATGWCNRFLTRMAFFPAAERMVTSLTGLTPRADNCH